MADERVVLSFNNPDNLATCTDRLYEVRRGKMSVYLAKNGTKDRLVSSGRDSEGGYLTIATPLRLRKPGQLDMMNFRVQDDAQNEPLRLTYRINFSDVPLGDEIHFVQDLFTGSKFTLIGHID